MNNKKQPAVSIIVPVYNVSMYVEKCLQALVGQSLNNMEIILVDDGSTDTSGQICDQYAEKYQNISPSLSHLSVQHFSQISLCDKHFLLDCSILSP